MDGRVLQGLAEKICCPVIAGNGRIPLLQSPATSYRKSPKRNPDFNTGRRAARPQA